MKKTFGITSFLETGYPGKTITFSHEERILNAIEEIKLADRVGLDFYGIGEHHRSDFAASAPATILAAAAAVTEHIHLGTAVTVLSSEDPIRVYQQFATLDLISNGRAEIMAGRGSFIESFPLFGYELKDYDRLFEEKLELLLAIREQTQISYHGYFHKLEEQSVYPRSKQERLKVSIAVGGTPESVIRAGKLGLPIVFAIIGGEPIRFKPLIDLYKRIYLENGHDPDKMEIGIHSHGFIGEDQKAVEDAYYPSHSAYMQKIGEERGWRTNYSKDAFIANIKQGPLYVGTPIYVARKIAKTMQELGIDRFMLHTPGAVMPHDMVMRNIELYGTEVVPMVKELLAKDPLD